MVTSRLFLDSDLPVNALIIGATGGIGLALMEQLAQHSQIAHLFGVARHANGNSRLSELAAAQPTRITLLDCDICDEAALDAMTQIIRSKTPMLHMVINTAGMLQNARQQPEKALNQLSLANLQSSFLINTFAPILLAKALLPLMRHHDPVIFASLSARVGSIGDNRAGGWYSYRAAKTAQNQLLKTLSIELRRLNPQSIVLALHPGTTDTALSKPFQSRVSSEKLFTPAYAAASLLNVIAERKPSDSGGFYAWDGQSIVW